MVIDAFFLVCWLILICYGIIASPQIVNMNNLPKGWELPKVHFWQNLSIFIIGLTFIRLFWRAWFSQKIEEWSSAVTEFYSFLIIFLCTAAWFLIPVLLLAHDKDAFPVLLYGNPYRHQGFFTMLGVFGVAGSVILFTLKDKIVDFLMASLLISSLLQTLVALQQILKLESDFPGQVLKYSDYVFGDFGQPNFYAGKLVLGVTLLIYFMARIYYWDFSWFKLWMKLIVWTILGSILPVFAFVAYYNRSDWALVTLGIFCVTLFLAGVFKVVSILWSSSSGINGVVLNATRLMLVGSTFVLIAVYLKFGFENYRLYIWSRSLAAMTPRNFREVINLLFGHGFDFLGNRFNRTSLVDGSFIDRAHNLFLDVMVNLGLVGFKLFFTGLVWVYHQLQRIGGMSFFLLLVLDALLIRSLVHTNSIVNVMDLVIVFAAAIGVILTPIAALRSSQSSKSHLLHRQLSA